MSETRIKKVNDLLRDEVADILKDEFDQDGVFITVVGANASSTLEHAAIRISVFPSDKADDATGWLKRNIFDIQQELNKRLVMRKVPKIRFELDKTEEIASHIEEVLDKIER